MNTEVRKIVTGIVRYLSATRTMHLLPQIAYELNKKVGSLADSSRAIVTSSYQLSNHEIVQIQHALRTVFCKNLQIVNRIDPQLIAGLKITVQDKVIDLSLKKTLQNIKSKLDHG
jgi:F-type H+-transporting ATPase subunit delta